MKRKKERGVRRMKRKEDEKGRVNISLFCRKSS